MRSRRDARSPWGKRLYFEAREFEGMMIDLIDRAGSDVFVEGTGVDVDQVLLQAFGLEADYVTLPEGVLGRTLFLPDGPAQIEVSRELADEAETDGLARRRLRTTLAHECGHVACHRSLFLADTETISLFGDPPAGQEKPAILCREASVDATTKYSGEWWEFQANQCMACLLMPKRLLVPRYENVLAAVGVDSFAEAVIEDIAKDIVRTLANLFDVSWQALLFRLQEIGFIPREGEGDQGVMELDR